MLVFPLRTFAVAGSLTILTSSLALLTAASKVDGRYPYNTATIPLFSELLKFAIATYLLHKQQREAAHGHADTPRITRSTRGMLLFLFPSVLYWVHNNLQFWTLNYIDPSTYQVLGNLKIATTALLFRLMLGRRVSVLQWLALLLLTTGTTVSQLHLACEAGRPPRIFSAAPIGYALALLSAMLSGLGAVYTEWVLKRNADALQWQNMQLYGLGVLVNTAGLMVNGEARGGWWALTRGYGLLTWLIVVNLAGSGMVVSWLMKFGDSILKVYSTSMAMVLTMLAALWLFGTAPTLQLVLGVVVISTSIALYYVPPSTLLQGAASLPVAPDPKDKAQHV